MCYTAAVGYDIGCDGMWSFLSFYETFSSESDCWEAIQNHIKNTHWYRSPSVCGGIPDYACNEMIKTTCGNKDIS